MWKPSPGYRHQGNIDPRLLHGRERIVTRNFFAPEYVRRRGRVEYYEGYNRVSGDGQGTYWP